MKKSIKITLIVAAALVGLGLCLSAVGFAMGGRLGELKGLHLDPATGKWEQQSTREPTEDLYTGGDYISDKTDITVLDIDWITGDVKVRLTNDDTITVEETVSDNGYDAHPMVVTDDNGTLKIRYADKAWMNAIDPPQKALTVYLPRAVAESLTEVSFTSVSADLDVKALTVAESFTFSSVSGDLKTDTITAEAVAAEVSTVSGEIELDGSFLRVTGESTSGKIDVKLRNCPEKLDVVTVSGDVELELPDSTNFWLGYDTVSGEIDCEVPVQRDGEHYYRGLSMGCDISVSTTSGDLKIERLN